jgi:hypothetical protein
LITEKDIDEMIAKYQGKKDITSDECVKLSAFYILKNALYPEVANDINVLNKSVPQYSYATAPEQPTYDSGTEFSNAIQGMDINDILYVFDDLMKATYVYNQPLYKATLRNLREY